MTQLLKLDVGSLRLSNTGAQAERRKRFDKAAIRELADSILSIGLQQPIVVRPIARSNGLNYLPSDPTHEVVAAATKTKKQPAKHK